MEGNKRIFRVLALLFMLCLVSTAMISGTFAKYTSEYSGQDTALVATWYMVTYAGQDPGDSELTEDDFMSTTETKELALFDHEYNIHINQEDDGKFIVAPGVGGEFMLALGNFSDVAADVKIDFEPLDSNATVSLEPEDEGSDPQTCQLPIEYSADGETTWVTLDGLAAAVVGAIVGNTGNVGVYATSDNDVFRIGAIGSVTSGENPECMAVQRVQWRWSYDPSESVYDYASDELDTAFGRLSATLAESGDRASYGIGIKFTATQVAPEAATP